MNTFAAEDVVAQFEQGRTDPATFRHADHVRLAFEYLQRYPVLAALEKFSTALRRFAAAQGKPDRYHETITWAYLFLIRERMARAGEARQSWEFFAARNSDLLTWEKGTGGALSRYYRPETLASPEARATFVLPDMGGSSEQR